MIFSMRTILRTKQPWENYQPQPEKIPEVPKIKQKKRFFLIVMIFQN
jgi:hypothetical protein